MADNSQISNGSGDIIGADDVTTLNGAASSGVKIQRMKVGFGVENAYVDASATTPLPVVLPSGGFASIVNFTEAQQAANAVFTGTAEDVSMYANIKITIYSSHASATNGLQIQQSHNGTVWFTPTPDTYTIPAGALKIFSISPSLKFFRIVYTNGATLTTQFLISSLFYISDKQPSSVRPQDGRGNDNDFVEVLSALIGYNPGADTWDRLRTSIANGLQVDVTRSALPTGAATDGTDITTPTAMPAGGLGIRGWLSSIWTKLNGSLAVTGTFFQATQPVSLATNTPVIAAGANAIGNINELRASNLAVTVTAASATAATLTLPAVAGQFHYITALDILLYSAAARTGAATPTVVTSTNLPGAIAFTFSTAGAIGTADTQDLLLVTPLKSVTVNTATTIVAPIAAGGIWRITATYFTGA